MFLAKLVVVFPSDQALDKQYFSCGVWQLRGVFSVFLLEYKQRFVNINIKWPQNVTKKDIKLKMTGTERFHFTFLHLFYSLSSFYGAGLNNIFLKRETHQTENLPIVLLC